MSHAQKRLPVVDRIQVSRIGEQLERVCIRVLVRANVLVPVQSLGAGNLSVGRSEQAGGVCVECVRVRLDAGGGHPVSEEAKRHESGEYAGLSEVYGHSC